jgi:sugar phosphate isomerase/epimerase
MMRLGIFARTYARPSLEAVLDAVVADGLHAVQFNPVLLDGPGLEVERVAAAHAERGLTLVAASGTYNMAHPDPAVRAEGASRLAAIIAAAPGWGAPVVTLCTGTRDPSDMWRAHPDNGSPEAWSDMRASVAAAVALAEDAGIVLAVEPEPGNVVGHARAARALLDQIRSPALRIVLDAANLLAPDRLPDQRRVLEEAFELLWSELVLAHAKDLRPDGSVVAAGQGSVDYDTYLELLRAAGFDGALVLHGLAESEVPGSVAFLRGRSGVYL